jgi:hypothetical protein
VLVFGAFEDRAHADKYLESRFPRSGFAIGLGIGPGFFLGMGDYDDLLGVGLASSVRLGTTAGPRSLLVLQLDSVAYLAEYVHEETTETKTHTNIHSTLTLGGQYYARELLWIKAGMGLSTIAKRKELGAKIETLSKGFGVMTSCGYDAFHRGSFALGIEATLAVGIYGDGVIVQLGANLAANWY